MADDNEDVPSLPDQVVYPEDTSIGTAQLNTVNVAPPTGVPDVSRGTDYAERGLIPTVESPDLSVPAGSPGVAVQGSPLSKDEEDFWRANPNGAVMDYTTGNLVGLGDRQPGHLYSDSGPYYVNAGLGPPAIRYDQQNRITTGEGPPSIVQPQTQQQSLESLQPRLLNESDFTDPLVQNQLNNVRADMATSAQRLRGLSTVSPRRGEPSPYHVELDRYNQLQNAERTLMSQLHRTSQQRLAIEQENHRRQTGMDNANAATALSQWARNIQAPIGSPERDKAIMDGFAQHPEWINALKGNKEFESVIQNTLYGAPGTHRAVKQVQSLQQMYQGAQTKQNQGDLAYLVQENIPIEQFAQRSKVEAGNYQKDANRNIALDANGQPIFAGADNGPDARVTIGSKTFGMPMDMYRRLANVIPSAIDQQPAKPQPTLTPVLQQVGSSLREQAAKIYGGDQNEPQAQPTTAPAQQPQFVTMRAPDGTTKQVSPNMVRHYQSLGATVVQ